MKDQKRSKGPKLWQKAKKIIPGGGMLLSKRAEMFLPNIWPSYYSKAKGCEVWDLDNKHYYDLSLMGVGTNILGYSNDQIDNEVKLVIDKSNMSTLNCPEEVKLCEALIEMHPWADMVRLSRTGGEANSIAVRIARAASGKDGVAICGYHGWHDWYLSVNLNQNDGLSEHLLPGLSTHGVPKSLKDTTFSFKYNDYKSLEELVKNKSIGVIKMEVSRNEPPKDNFLEKVRELATKNNIVLIFDECTSGFRQSFGGLHKVFGVDPDIAIYGKALGNGYAITAVVGRKEIMEVAQSSFISSTFWTERIGPTAAIKTLEVMKKTKSWEYISKTGRDIKKRWIKIFDNLNLSITISGIDALPSFVFNNDKPSAYKTFITQEMLKRGYLAGTSIYVSLSHSEEIIDKYFTEFEDVIGETVQAENKGMHIEDMLEGPTCHSGFERLN